jgi:hypothetical protein
MEGHGAFVENFCYFGGKKILNIAMHVCVRNIGTIASNLKSKHIALGGIKESTI